MRIVIELSEEQFQAVDKFRREQTKAEVNPITGQQMMVEIYKDVPDLIVQTVGATVVTTAMNRYPPPSAIKDLQDIQEIQKRAASRAMPIALAEELIPAVAVRE